MKNILDCALEFGEIAGNICGNMALFIYPVLVVAKCQKEFRNEAECGEYWN